MEEDEFKNQVTERKKARPSKNMPFVFANKNTNKKEGGGSAIFENYKARIKQRANSTDKAVVLNLV